MKDNLINLVDSIANSPKLNLAFGLFFFACGVSEIVHEIEQEFKLKAHHGMVVFGIAHAFKSLSMLLKGLKS
jgi:hypothetical protein